MKKYHFSMVLVVRTIMIIHYQVTHESSRKEEDKRIYQNVVQV